MGNLCGKESGSSSLPNGRALGSGQPATSTSTGTGGRIPLADKPKIASGPGRTLGGAAGSGAEAEEQLDARAAAALAAEERSRRNAATGKLGLELEKQKRKTNNQHLQDLGRTGGRQEPLVWD